MWSKNKSLFPKNTSDTNSSILNSFLEFLPGILTEIISKNPEGAVFK